MRSAAKDIKSHSSSCGGGEQMFYSELSWSCLICTPYVPHVAVLIIPQIEGWAEEWGPAVERLGREKMGGLGERVGGGGGLWCVNK